MPKVIVRYRQETQFRFARSNGASLFEVFRGRDVVILADNDWAGSLHADDVEKQLRRVAGSVRRLSLPVDHKGDVSDFLDAGHTLEELLAHVAKVEALNP